MVACTAASAIGFYLSFNHGDVWPLAWLAPIPVLWLAFAGAPGRVTFTSCWAAYALGYCNVLPAYAAVMPVFILALALTVSAFGFAVSVLGAQFVARRISPLAGVLAFPSLWTTWDYIMSFSSAAGTALSPAYSQVGAPYLIQGACVFGLWIVTFLLGLVAAGIAMSVAKRTAVPAVVAVAVLLIDIGFAAWRILGRAPTDTISVGLAVNDAVGRASFSADPKTASAALRGYLDAGHALAAQGARLIIFPEKLAVVEPAWRDTIVSDLKALAAESHATIVAGFDERGDVRRNEALIVNAAAPLSIYLKRRLVAGLEASFSPGDSALVLSDGTGIAICKDMDFQSMLRKDANKNRVTLVAVPAWDFDGDAWWHARIAIMRGVEDGFAVARAAKQGLLSLSDAYGRVIGLKRSTKNGMVVLVGDLPRGPGDTLYLRLGDVFALASGVVSVGLLLAGALRHARK